MHDNDTVYFAHCFPYTYSDLQLYIYNLKKDSKKSEMFKHSVLGKSFGGNYIDMLSVTSKADSPEYLRSRRAIVVSARVHPGETNSSWMMRGFIEFILSADPQAQYLRDNYIVRVIPMINPGTCVSLTLDGVIVGNHRCNLNGYDLNRHWLSNLTGAPEVNIVKSMISRLMEERDIVLYCDLHVISLLLIVRDIIERMAYLCMAVIMTMMKNAVILKEFFHFYYHKEPQISFSLKNANLKFRKARKELEG